MTNELINKVLQRGIEKIYPSRKALSRALKNPGKLTFYLGIDPTAPLLHLGHTIPARKLEQLRQLGCRTILLIGGFTATIGDPTDKLAARKVLSVKDVERNAKNYLKLLEPILGLKAKKNPVEVKNNIEWWGKMSYAEFTKLAERASVQRLLERDMFQERIKKGAIIHLHELHYPLMQAYDSVVMSVDGEVGATDQTFNMLMGRNLVRSMQGREKFVLTTGFLPDPSGKKMSKTEGNAVPLDSSPDDMFGKIMSWPDEMVASSFELLTSLDMKEVKKMKKDLSPRDFKARLAREIVTIYHGKAAAEKAEKQFEKVFSEKRVPEDIAEIELPYKNMRAVDLLTAAGMAKSKSEAKRVIEQGGMSVNDSVIEDSNEDIEVKSGMVIKRGKRRFVQIK